LAGDVPSYINIGEGELQEQKEKEKRQTSERIKNKQIKLEPTEILAAACHHSATVW
jgi:hypothetical protein